MVKAIMPYTLAREILIRTEGLSTSGDPRTNRSDSPADKIGHMQDSRSLVS
jgi:hypothetical protein